MTDSQRVHGAGDSPQPGDDADGRNSSNSETRPHDADRTAELYEVLSDPRRRRVLSCLRSSRTPMALADLTDDLLRREADASPSAAQDERERIYVSLYHRHLPKLGKAGLVSFDIDRKLVGLCAAAGARNDAK